MSKHSFQLTYSVYPLHENEESKESADKARYLIRNIKGWGMLDKIETTLVGELYLDSLHISKKREDAEDIVDSVIRDVLHDNGVFQDVKLYASLMVDGLGEHITFKL